ncbi:10008_t:CDS:1, partial [Dentiscutata heterogama]
MNSNHDWYNSNVVVAFDTGCLSSSYHGHMLPGPIKTSSAYRYALK